MSATSTKYSKLLHAAIRDNEAAKRRAALSNARHEHQARMIRIAQDIVVMQINAQFEALVWGMRNGI